MLERPKYEFERISSNACSYSLEDAEVQCESKMKFRLSGEQVQDNKNSP